MLQKTKVLFILMAFALPFFSNAQKIEDFSQYFKNAELTGGFFLYDFNKKEYTISGKDEFERPTSPASTFKIINSLIALETGAIKDENEVLKWDGTKHENETWNADTDMKNAFKNSTVWFYQEIAKKVGEKNYEKFLKKCDFGNQDISSGLTNFWLGKSLEITPKNQIEFLVKLYENKLPFSQRSMDLTKKMMIREESVNYTIKAKTGWARKKGEDIGWWVGYVEKKDNVYFFAIRIYKPLEKVMPDFGNKRMAIVTAILKEKGVL